MKKAGRSGLLWRLGKNRFIYPLPLQRKRLPFAGTTTKDRRWGKAILETEKRTT